MAILFVRQAVAVTSNATTCVITITAPAVGNTLILTFANGLTTTPTGITGGGVTWAPYKEQDAGAFNANIWYGLNSSGSGTTITITYAAKTAVGANVSEWSGITATDLTAGATGTSVTPDAGAVTATLDDSLVIAAVNNFTRGITPVAGPTNSFTALTYADSGDDGDLLAAYRITTVGGSYSTAWTVVVGEWAAAIATFQGTAGGATGHPTMRRWGGMPGMTPGRPFAGSGRSYSKVSALWAPDYSIERAA